MSVSGQTLSQTARDLQMSEIDYLLQVLQETANAPESFGVDNEIFGEMVKHFTKQQEENKKLKATNEILEFIREENNINKKNLMNYAADHSKVKEEKYCLYLKWTEVKTEKDKLKEENEGLQQELKDVRKLELAHMDTIKSLKSEV